MKEEAKKNENQNVNVNVNENEKEIKKKEKEKEKEKRYCGEGYNCHEDNKADVDFSEIKNYRVESVNELKEKSQNLLNPDNVPINEKQEKENVEEKNQIEEKETGQNKSNGKKEQENKEQNVPKKKMEGEKAINQKQTIEHKEYTETTEHNMRETYAKLPTVIIVIGMAGSGKTTYVGSLYNYLKVEKKKKVYTMNLDPAVKYIHYPANIDIRDSIKYHEIMKEYKLGPNGAIMTCLNLFATRFDKVIELLEKRKNSLQYIIIDTPGQIEVFNWSASGNIILETLSVSFPVIINYVIDTVRCERPVTFMSNMLYACSVLYKSRLPFLACFNKIDILRHNKCIEWMKNFDTFNEDVLNDVSYMASFSRSCALMINEFYEEIKTIGISSKTNEGFHQILKNLELLKQEYIDEFVPRIQRQMKRIKRKKDEEIKAKMETLQRNLTTMSNITNH